MKKFKPQSSNSTYFIQWLIKNHTKWISLIQCFHMLNIKYCIPRNKNFSITCRKSITIFSSKLITFLFTIMLNKVVF